jgi:beta-phosphoglucomutase-like phosphatase (HAD superfamily)
MKLIVFDLDGVLLDFCEVHYETLNQAICEVVGQSFSISREEHETTYNGRSTRAKLSILGERKGLAPLLFEKIFARKQELTATAVSRVSKSAVLCSMLIRLRDEGYQTACATNCIRATLDSALDSLGIRDLFTFTVSNEDVRLPKPDPEIYQLCHRKAGVTANETLIFEDSPVGLASARSSGSRVVCVSTPSSLTEEFVMAALTPITIVIPMAGNGSRFTRAGYTDPKPLIPVHGKPMISWVVDNLAVPCARFVFVIRADYPESCKDYLRSIAPGCFILVVDKVTEGAACTVLLAKDLINDDTPLLIANSDQFIEFDAGQFVQSFLNSGADGKISTFDGDKNPKWSYAAVKDGYVTEVREKDPFSDHATTGVYMWRRGSDFVRFAEQMIGKNIRVNNEFYTVPVYNEAIADGLKITIDTCKQMWGLGVPEDLEYFLTNYTAHRITSGK